MMKRLLSLLSAVALTGCVSVHEARLEDGSLSVEIDDSGWYILGFIPIVSGNPDGNWPHWFCDDVDPRTTTAVLDRLLVRERATEIRPVVTHATDEKVLFLITRLCYHTSAVIPPPTE